MITIVSKMTYDTWMEVIVSYNNLRGPIREVAGENPKKSCLYFFTSLLTSYSCDTFILFCHVILKFILLVYILIPPSFPMVGFIWNFKKLKTGAPFDEDITEFIKR